MNSCSQDIDSYQFTINNEYFEPLYQTRIGDLLYDTILTSESSPLATIDKGTYEFVTETKSGLMLTSTIQFQGDNQNIKLIVEKTGKLRVE